MERPKKSLSVAAVREALLKKNGNMAAVGRLFGVTRQAVRQFVRSRKELEDAVADARETNLDDAEDSLLKAVKRGEGWAVCFFLKTQGKRRGYVERDEFDPDEEAITTLEYPEYDDGEG